MFAVGQLRDSLRESGRSDGVIAAAARAERLTVDLETGLRGYLLTGDVRFLEPTREAQRAVAPQARQLRRLVADNRAQAQRAAAIERSLADYSTGYIEREIAAGADRSRSEPTAATREGKGLVDPIRAQIDALTAAERRRALAREAEADATEHRSFVIRAIGFAILVLSFALGIAYLVRVVLAPVRDVAGGRRPARGRRAGRPRARAGRRRGGRARALVQRDGGRAGGQPRPSSSTAACAWARPTASCATPTRSSSAPSSRRSSSSPRRSCSSPRGCSCCRSSARSTTSAPTRSTTGCSPRSAPGAPASW